MWLIIDRENNKDPVAPTLGDRAFLGRFTILHDTGGDDGVRRVPGGFGNIAEVVGQLDPQRIGINVSDVWNNGDGLSKALYDRLEAALGEASTRLVSAEDLSNEWLETKTPEEISAYRHVAGVTHDIISEAFSNRVIVPDVTTVGDVNWWIAQKIADLGLQGWAFSVVIQRSPQNRRMYDDPPELFSIDEPSSMSFRGEMSREDVVIRRGDILHSDIGTEYVGLNTDNQQHSYILRDGETDVPEGLKEALRRANRVQDIFMSEFQLGRTGNEIRDATLQRATAEGLKAMIYTHPIGYHQHSGGTVLGGYSSRAQVDSLPRGRHPLRNNTVYSIELENIYAVPEWEDLEVEIALEEQGVFTEQGASFLDGRQVKWFLIR